MCQRSQLQEEQEDSPWNRKHKKSNCGIHDMGRRLPTRPTGVRARAEVSRQQMSLFRQDTVSLLRVPSPRLKRSHGCVCILGFGYWQGGGGEARLISAARRARDSCQCLCCVINLPLHPLFRKKSCRNITYDEFKTALAELARKKYKEKSGEEAEAEIFKLVEGKSPVISGVTVRLVNVSDLRPPVTAG